MIENIRVVCLLERHWDIGTHTYLGEEKSGLLINTGMEGEIDNLISVGIVLFDDNTFGSIPIEFIKKEVII